MMATPGSGKWVAAMIFAILVAVVWTFPQQTLFLLKFFRDLVALNLQSFFDSVAQMVHQHFSH
ncbi:MAG TPA: hypothetical protein VHE12_13035 [bacterium]|nr:hypothetical protein [bacterium]